MRKIIIKRKKSFVGCLLPIHIVIDGSTPFETKIQLKSGEKAELPLNDNGHIIAAYGNSISTLYSNVLNIEPGLDDKYYYIYYVMGWVKSSIVLKETTAEEFDKLK